MTVAVPTAVAPTVRDEWWRAETASDSAGRGLPEAGVRRASASFGALVAFTIVLILSPQTLVPSLAPFRLALLAALVAAGSHVYESLRLGLPLFHATLANAFALALVAWALLTAPLSYWPGGSVALLLGLYLKALVVFWLVGSVVQGTGQLKRLCAVLSVLALPLAATAVRNYATGAFLPSGAVRRIAGYDAPLTQNPNDLALMLNLILPLTIALWLDSRPGWLRLALGGAVGLSVAAIILTFSRGGFLCLASTALAYLVKIVRQGRLGWTALAVGGLAAGILCLPDGYSARLSTISDVSSDPTLSAQLRWADMVLAARYVADNPMLGAGIGMNALALNDLRGPAWKEVHNAYLQYGVDLGLPGLSLFLGLLLSCLAIARKVELRCGAGVAAARSLGALAEGIRTSLVAFAVGALFHPVAYEFYFFYVGGLAVAAGAASERECSP